MAGAGTGTIPERLRAFRGQLHACFPRRADALFELTDAILTAGTVPSPPHLSLVPVHRRGWVSLYAALSKGRIEAGALRDLLAARASDDARSRVYAVDVSPWPRCDAEASPGRCYLYHPSKHSAGQPIVAGWAYQFVAGLGFERDSWVTPVDARRVLPEEDANDAAARQVTELVGRIPPGERRRRPKALWLWWHGSGTPDLDLVWRAYCRRFDVEHFVKFLKGTLGWTAPRVRHPEQADRWTWLVLAAYAQLLLARSIVADRRLPWERPLPAGSLTPTRVLRNYASLLPAVGTPASAPKPCGRSAGRPKGSLSGTARRYPAVKKSA